MRFVFLLSIILTVSCFTSHNKVVAATGPSSQLVEQSSVGEEFGPRNPVAKKKKHKKRKKRIKEDKKPFPLFAFLALICGLLALGSFFLGIALGFPAYIGFIALGLAIAALTLGVMGPKKGSPRPFSFVGIILGVMGVIGSILFLVSALG